MSSVEWHGSEYAENSKPQYQWAMEILRRHPWQGNESLLDIGCGDGKITLEVAERYLPDGRAVGIDPSASQIAVAEANDEEGRVEWHRMGAEEVGSGRLSSKTFDVVSACTSLHWVRDHRQALAGIRGVMKDGATFAYNMVLCPNDEGRLQDGIDRLVQRDEWRAHFAEFVPPWWCWCGWWDASSRLCRDPGDSELRDAAIEDYCERVLKDGPFERGAELRVVVKDTVVGPSPDDWWTYCSQWLPHKQAVPEARRDEFMDDLRSLVPREDGLDSFVLLYATLTR